MTQIDHRHETAAKPIPYTAANMSELSRAAVQRWNVTVPIMINVIVMLLINLLTPA